MMKKLCIGILLAILLTWVGHSALQNPSPGKIHWQDKPYWNWGDGTNDLLVCDDNGKVIASVMRGGSTPNDTYAVFGGNGLSYGDYTTLEAAKHVAESIRYKRGAMGSKWIHCP